MRETEDLDANRVLGLSKHEQDDPQRVRASRPLVHSDTVARPCVRTRVETALAEQERKELVALGDESALEACL